MSGEPSPLSTVTPDALTALFTADPLTLSDADLMGLVQELRRRRNEFTASEAAKSLKPKAAKTKPDPASAPTAAAMDKPTKEFGLDDLL